MKMENNETQDRKKHEDLAKQQHPRSADSLLNDELSSEPEIWEKPTWCVNGRIALFLDDKFEAN